MHTENKRERERKKMDKSIVINSPIAVENRYSDFKESNICKEYGLKSVGSFYLFPFFGSLLAPSPSLLSWLTLSFCLPSEHRPINSCYFKISWTVWQISDRSAVIMQFREFVSFARMVRTAKCALYVT